MRLSDHQAGFTEDIARLIRLVPYLMPNHRVRLRDVQRSEEEQQRLVDAGISPTMNSQHVKSMAADMVLDRKSEAGWEYLRDTRDYQRLGVKWEAMSLFNRWGGRYHDGNHFERLEHPRDDQPPLYA